MQFDLLVDANGRAQGNNGSIMLFGLRQGQAQIGVLAPHHFHMPVLEELEIAGANEAIDHKANGPRQVWRHGAIAEPQLEVLAQLVVRQGMVLAPQLASCSHDLPVFAGCECASRAGLNFDAGKLWQLLHHPHPHSMVEHFAHSHKVLTDRDGAKTLAQEMNKVL